MIFYGSFCEKTALTVVVGYALLLLTALLIFLFALRVFRDLAILDRSKSKRSRKKLFLTKKWSTSLTESAMVLISLGFFISYCVSNVCRSLNVGNQYLEQNFITPLSFQFYSAGTVSSLSNICFLWIELGYASVSAATHKNVKRSRKLLSFCSIFYFLLTSILFVWTFSYQWVAVVLCVYMFLVAVGILKGSTLISKKLQIKRLVSMSLPSVFSSHHKHLKISLRRRSKVHASDQLQSNNQRSNRRRSTFLSVRHHQHPPSRCSVESYTSFLKQDPLTPAHRDVVKNDRLQSTPAMHSSRQSLKHAMRTSNTANQNSSPECDKKALCSQPPPIPRKRVSVVQISSHPEAKKVIDCARKIFWSLIFFCSASLLYHFFSASPKFKYYLFFCQIAAMLDSLYIHMCILNFVSGRSGFNFRCSKW